LSFIIFLIFISSISVFAVGSGDVLTNRFFCNDSDGGMNYYEKGEVIAILGNMTLHLTDGCGGESLNNGSFIILKSSDILIESYCTEDGIAKSVEYNCSEEGKICREGACVEEDSNCSVDITKCTEGNRSLFFNPSFSFCGKVSYSNSRLEKACEVSWEKAKKQWFFDELGCVLVEKCLNGCTDGRCVEANIYYVSPTGAGSHNGTRGNEFSLNEAQTFANNNADERITFILNSGNYGQVTFNKQRSQYMTWKQAPDSPAKFEKIKIYGASYIEFDDLNVFGLGAHNQTVGIDIRNGDHITIKNSRISEAMNGIVASGYKIDINNNLIYSVGSDQINVVGPANVIFIEKNRILNTNPIPLAHADGIHLYGFGYNISEVFIRNNVFSNLSGQGISSDGVRNLTIEGNNMYKVYLWDILLINTHTGVITGNYIESYGNFSGIFICNSTCTNIHVYNNTIQTNEICGNNMLEEDEVCDGSALGEKTCQSFGYDEGNLSCCRGCKSFDFSRCKNVSKYCHDNDQDMNQTLRESFYIASGVGVGGEEHYGMSCPGMPSPGGVGWGGFIKDKCEGNILIERICNGTEASFIEYKCPEICIEGACYLKPILEKCGDGKCGESIEKTLRQNESITLEIDGKTYYVKIAHIKEGGVGIAVNELPAVYLLEGSTKELDGLFIYAKKVDYASVYSNLTSSVILVFGETEKTCPQDCKTEKCEFIGLRKDGKYCSLDKMWETQKEEGECGNNFECRSNLCLTEKCVDFNLLRKIIEFFRRFFRV